MRFWLVVAWIALVVSLNVRVTSQTPPPQPSAPQSTAPPEGADAGKKTETGISGEAHGAYKAVV